MPHANWVLAAHFDPDGKRIATAAAGGRARIWNSDTGDLLLQLPKHNGPIVAVQFSSDGKRIVTVCGDHPVEVWDAATGQLLQQYQTSTIAEFSQDGRRLVIGSDDHTAQIWNTQTWQPLTPMLPHDSNVILAQFSSPRRLASARGRRTSRPL
jgi:WD40 repeat protein